MLFSGEKPTSSMPLLVLEAGNTGTSCVVFQGIDVLEKQRVPSVTLSVRDGIDGMLAPILVKYPALCDAAICSVIPSLNKSIRDYLSHHLSGQVLTVSASMALPFTLHYSSPDSFGADRLALCALSQSLFPEEAVIAIDAGTAITVDVLGSSHHYLGGLIMPGLDLMAKALHEHTAQLPLITLDRPETLLGCSTVAGIRSGIVHGCVSGIDGMVGKIRRWLYEERGETEVRVLLTGGNASLIAGMLDFSPAVEELAVVKGTRTLFYLNASISD